MKKILGLGVVALLVMALVGGGTWAYFSDVETSSNNVLLAGTLDLGLGNTSGEAEDGVSATSTWTSPAGWKPGDSVDAILYLKNVGTIDMASVNVTFGHAFTDSPTSGNIHGNLPGGDTDNISKMIKMNVATWNGTATMFQGDSLYVASNNGTMNLGILAGGATAELRIVWLFDSTASNGCQGDQEDVTLTITGMQQ